MGYYAHYASRHRNRLGLRTKIFQAGKIFKLGTAGITTNPMSVLEIGPGDGYIADLSRKNKYSYIGIEASASVADNLLLKGYNIIHKTVPPLPRETGSFDVCFVLHVIEHIKHMDAATQLIGDIRNCLNNSGRLVIACPDYNKWKQLFYDCDYTHCLPFTKRRLVQLLINEGFTISYQTIYIGPVFGYRGLPLYWLAKLFYPTVLDDLTAPYFKNDTPYRGFLTLMPNLLVVAVKTS